MLTLRSPCTPVPDANYFSSNNPPQGEVWIRGGSVSKGYYKRDDVTAEAFTEDGWLKTGDIGQWNADGTLSIIDRKKNLVKLAGGEYIAIERLESIYKSCVRPHQRDLVVPRADAAPLQVWSGFEHCRSR